MASFFLPSRTNSSSASVGDLPTDTRNLFQARIWAGWLSTMTPSRSKITLFSMGKVLRRRNPQSGPGPLHVLVAGRRSYIHQIVGNGVGCHVSDEFGQKVKGDIGWNAIRDHIKNGWSRNQNSGEA